MKKLTWLAGLLLLTAGAPAALAATISYDVVTTFFEPGTQPRNSIFKGTFDFDTVSGTVSSLRGCLTESMTGGGMGGMGGMSDPGCGMSTGMTEIRLQHQLDVQSFSSGVLVTAFRNDSTSTLSTMGGGDGFTPGTGFGLYYGFPGTNPNNAYVRIFVNTTDPTTPLTQAQIDKLAYADCAPGGMMSGTCMTGTSVAGYGALGTMGGYPVSQVVTMAVPEPGTGLLMLAGVAALRRVARRRRA